MGISTSRFTWFGECAVLFAIPQTLVSKELCCTWQQVCWLERPGYSFPLPGNLQGIAVSFPQNPLVPFWLPGRWQMVLVVACNGPGSDPTGRALCHGLTVRVVKDGSGDGRLQVLQADLLPVLAGSPQVQCHCVDLLPSCIAA